MQARRRPWTCNREEVKRRTRIVAQMTPRYSSNAIAERLGVTSRTVLRYRARLRQAGEIE